MLDANEDKNLADFFESFIEDPTEKKILQLILEGKDGDSIIEELLADVDYRDKKNSIAKGKSS